MAGSVLYIDDDRALCQIVERAFSAEGYEVRTAFDGHAGLDSIEAEPPDLIFLDLLLPGLDGFQVLERIRALEEPVRSTPVVLVTGCTPTPSYAARANELQAVDLLAKPVPLRKFIEVVAAEIGEAKPPPPSAGRTPARERPPSLSGDFSQISFPLILHHLHGMRATGVLEVAVEKTRKWVELREGYPIAMRSNLVRETLGHFLVRSGRITQAVLDECLTHMGKGKRQGEILVAMDVLGEDEMVDVLREQANDKFFEIFEWGAGSFRFERDRTLPRGNSLGIGRSPASLILEGVQTRFSLDDIDSYLDSHADQYLSHGEGPFFRFQEIQLGKSDEAALRDLDGTRSLSDFLAEGESFRRTLYGLICAGVLQLRDEPGAAPPPQAREANCEQPAPAVVAEPVGRNRGRTGAVDARGEDERHLALVKLADQLRGKSHFELLGVTPDDDRAALDAAYGSLAEQTHPDRFSGGSKALRDLAGELHELIRSAYEKMLDPRAHQQYQLDEKKREREQAKQRKSDRAYEADSEFRKGQTALGIRDYETALAHFGCALQLYPDEGDHHAYYGWALHLCHPGDPSMFGEALEHVKRGLKLASHRETVYLFLGRLYKVIGRVDVAERSFARAVQIQPECVEALRELRLINMRREKSKSFIGRILRR